MQSDALTRDMRLVQDWLDGYGTGSTMTDYRSGKVAARTAFDRLCEALNNLPEPPAEGTQT